MRLTGFDDVVPVLATFESAGPSGDDSLSFVDPFSPRDGAEFDTDIVFDAED